MPFPEDTIPVKGLPKMVKRIAFAVDKTNNEKPMLRCVNLMFTKDGLKAAGSDGHCVATAKGDANSTGDIAMMVPAASLGSLARISSDKDEFRVGTTGKSIVFMKKDLFFSARILDGEYIDTDKLIARLTNRFTVLADMEELRRIEDEAKRRGKDGERE
jgi:DNA polymerase III sliding clamp (beta) subunit (PCNA family)